MLLGYCIIAYCAFMVINDSKDFTVVLWCILISCVILSVIGISHIFDASFCKEEMVLVIVFWSWVCVADDYLYRLKIQDGLYSMICFVSILFL